jgi:tetratricopeptide (TPR) repeat protein
VPLLRELEQDGPTEYGFETARREMQKAAAFAAVAYHAAVQLADHESATGNVHGAIEDYNVALWWVARLSDDFNSGDGMRPEVAQNNLALAYLAAGATDSARANADKALESDPMNPVFLMTAGFVAERAGNSDSAIDYNRRALESDPGAFAAANDLGVELARRGDYTGAQDALRQAVGAAPGYALGWFNLGVVESRRGPLRLLTSQGAFAKAFTLDPTLKDRKHELTIDGSVYRTALDLSKPLPPQWSLAQTQKSAPVASVGLLAIAMLGVGLARASGGRGGAFARQWLEPVTERLNKIRGPSWIQGAAVGVIVTVIAFLFTYLRHAGSVTEIVAYCVGVVLLGGLAYFAREAIAARQAVGVAQSSWTPGLALGLVTGALGTPWAPLPVARTDTESRHVHLAAPLALAAVSLALFVEVAWLDVPLTGAFAVAALIMTSSTLLPIKPLDGANLGSTGAVAAAGVMAGAVLVALGVA